MNASANSFVLFPLGQKRFALPAAKVTELARPDNLHQFPITTPLVNGVLLRRGEVVPVCDIAPVLMGADVPPRKFYLIAKRNLGSTVENTAIPVTGDCQLASSEMLQPRQDLAGYVLGLLSLKNEIVEVLDLEKLLSEAKA